jgi:hypothetical protein
MVLPLQFFQYGAISTLASIYLIDFARRCPPIVPDMSYERYLKAVLTRDSASYAQYRRIAGY